MASICTEFRAIGSAVATGGAARIASLCTRSGRSIALNSVQIEAIRCDPLFRSGDYYDAADGDGPTRGLALARRMALLNYRSPTELNERFERGWQSFLTKRTVCEFLPCAAYHLRPPA